MSTLEGEQFVGEAIEPVAEAMVSGGPGEPALPARFVWRGKEYAIAEVIEKWRDTGPCHHGSGERYVRKHWYRVRTADGAVMRIYFERQARSSRERARRWWLYAIVPAAG